MSNKLQPCGGLRKTSAKLARPQLSAPNLVHVDYPRGPWNTTSNASFLRRICWRRSSRWRWHSDPRIRPLAVPWFSFHNQALPSSSSLIARPAFPRERLGLLRREPRSGRLAIDFQLKFNTHLCVHLAIHCPNGAITRLKFLPVCRWTGVRSPVPARNFWLLLERAAPTTLLRQVVWHCSPQPPFSISCLRVLIWCCPFLPCAFSHFRGLVLDELVQFVRRGCQSSSFGVTDYSCLAVF